MRKNAEVIKKKKSSYKKHHKGTALQALLPKEGVGYTQRGKLSKAKDKESKKIKSGGKAKARNKINYFRKG